MKISRYAVNRPITVLMATVSVLVLGFIALRLLPLTMLPEFASSNLQVYVDYPSSSPEEVQRNITRPLEEYLSTLDGLEKIESTSSNSGSSIRLEFEEGMDMDMAALDVRDRTDQVRNDLPDDVERVMIRRWQSTDMPVYRFSVGWTDNRESLFQFTRDVLTRRLERIDGVANVDLQGSEAKHIVVDLNESLLQAYGVDVFNLGQTLRFNNISLSGGYVIDGEKKYTLRTIGEVTTPEEIADLPLQRGRLTIGDVAKVSYEFPERDSFSRLNGEEAATVYVYKASNANVVAVCSSIKKELAQISRMPAYQDIVEFHVYSDQSERILESLGDLRTAGLFGGALSMLVLFLFLMKLRSTLIISLAIPVSVIFTCAFMYLMRVFAGSEISLNIISLMGMMVAIGMLVDNSVVVLENIFRYKQEKGFDAREAALRGSSEVGVAVLASTATTVAVFASFIFLPNAVSGRFTKDFGITVAVSLIASLIVSLTLMPMIASRLFTGEEKPKQRLMVWITEQYGRFMRLLLRWRFATLILMGLLGYATVLLFSNIDREFFGGGTEREIRFEVLMERSFTVEQMQELFEQIESTLFEKKEELEIDSISARFQSRTTRRGQYRGDLNLFLVEEGDITPTLELRGKIQSLLPDVPGVEYRPGRMRRYGGGAEAGVTVELKGEDPLLLELYAGEVKGILESIPGLQDVQTTLESGDDEIHLSVDRNKLEKFQISSLSVARMVSSALGSRATTRVKGESEEIDVILQLKGANQVSLAELLNMNMENREGDLVPLHSVVDFEYRKGPVSIRREDRKAVVSVIGDTESGAAFFVRQEVQNRLSQLDLPPGYSWGMGSDFRRAQQGEEESTFAIVLALILMYIIMAALFESFSHPLTILFTVPFSLIGVALIFNFTDTSLNQSAYLGILVLFGIVVNNGIILIDHINLLRRSGMSRNEAIIQAGMDRHRPILMTACTSIFGLLPLTLPFILPEMFGEIGGGSSYWAPVSLAVFGGLTTSTFLTLVILPAVYTYMDDLGRGLKWLGLRIIHSSLFFRTSAVVK